jgi:hypothetical protein
VTVLADDGSVLAATGEIAGAPLRVPADVLETARREGRAAASIPISGGQDGETVRAQVRRWSREDLGLAGYVVAAQTSRRIAQDRVGLFVLFAVSGLITFVAAAIAVWFATGRALRPLRQMAVMADEFGGSQDLSRRLPAVSGRDAVEGSPLASTRCWTAYRRRTGGWLGHWRRSSASPPTHHTSCELHLRRSATTRSFCFSTRGPATPTGRRRCATSPGSRCA